MESHSVCNRAIRSFAEVLRQALAEQKVWTLTRTFEHLTAAVREYKQSVDDHHPDAETLTAIVFQAGELVSQFTAPDIRLVTVPAFLGAITLRIGAMFLREEFVPSSRAAANSFAGEMVEVILPLRRDLIQNQISRVSKMYWSSGSHGGYVPAHAPILLFKVDGGSGGDKQWNFAMSDGEQQYNQFISLMQGRRHGYINNFISSLDLPSIDKSIRSFAQLAGQSGGIDDRIARSFPAVDDGIDGSQWSPRI